MKQKGRQLTVAKLSPQPWLKGLLITDFLFQRRMSLGASNQQEDVYSKCSGLRSESLCELFENVHSGYMRRDEIKLEGNVMSCYLQSQVEAKPRVFKTTQPNTGGESAACRTDPYSRYLNSVLLLLLNWNWLLFLSFWFICFSIRHFAFPWPSL